VWIVVPVRRIQIQIDEEFDAPVAARAARASPRPRSSGRSSPSGWEPVEPRPDDPWHAITGWLDGDPVDDIDHVIYGPKA
jgi:hypothetical protein